MMERTPTDPLEAAVRVAVALREAGVPHAIGGALAYGWWAVPRATMDVDINVFVQDDGLDAALDALVEAGVTCDRETARADHRARGMFVGRLGPFRIDVFTPSIPFAREAERTRVRIELEGEGVDVLSREAIAVFKMLFFRTKDIADVERLLALQPALDTAYVRAHLVDMMGEDDERIVRWDRLCLDAATP